LRINSQHRSASFVTRLQARLPKTGVQIRTKTEIFLLTTTFKLGLWPTKAPTKWVMGDHSHCLNGQNTKHIANFKIITRIKLELYLHSPEHFMEWCSIKHRNITGYLMCIGGPCIVMINEEEKPTRCYLMFYYTYERLNKFQAALCPSSGAHDYISDYHVGCLILRLLMVGG
jgi:hypothetical protein